MMLSSSRSVLVISALFYSQCKGQGLGDQLPPGLDQDQLPAGLDQDQLPPGVDPDQLGGAQDQFPMWSKVAKENAVKWESLWQGMNGLTVSSQDLVQDAASAPILAGQASSKNQTEACKQLVDKYFADSVEVREMTPPKKLVWEGTSTSSLQNGKNVFGNTNAAFTSTDFKNWWCSGRTPGSFCSTEQTEKNANLDASSPMYPEALGYKWMCDMEAFKVKQSYETNVLLYGSGGKTLFAELAQGPSESCEIDKSGKKSGVFYTKMKASPDLLCSAVTFDDNNKITGLYGWSTDYQTCADGASSTSVAKGKLHKMESTKARMAASARRLTMSTVAKAPEAPTAATAGQAASTWSKCVAVGSYAAGFVSALLLLAAHARISRSARRAQPLLNEC